MLPGVTDKTSPPEPLGPQRGGFVDIRLSYLRMSALIFLFDVLHLVFDAQLELLEADFFHLLVFRQISFFDQGVKTLRVLTVFLGQPTKFLVAGKKLFANGLYHPEEPPACSFTKR
jgi:hypothetical protein